MVTKRSYILKKTCSFVTFLLSPDIKALKILLSENTWKYRLMEVWFDSSLNELIIRWKILRDAAFRAHSITCFQHYVNVNNLSFFLVYITFTLKFLSDKSGIKHHCKNYFLNPFHATDLILTPLKISENLGFSDVFRGCTKRPVVWNGLIRRLFWLCSSQKVMFLRKLCAQYIKITNF